MKTKTKWVKPIKIPYKVPKKELEEDRRALRQAKQKAEKHERKGRIQLRKLAHKERVYGRLRRHRGYLYKQFHIIFVARRTDIFEGEIEKQLSVWTVLMDVKHVLTWDDIFKAFLKAQFEKKETGWSYINHMIDRIHYKRIKGRTLEEWL